MDDVYTVLLAIPSSRAIQFTADPDTATMILPRYGTLCLAAAPLGPHVLQVDDSLNFEIVVSEVKYLLAEATPHTRSVGQKLYL